MGRVAGSMPGVDGGSSVCGGGNLHATDMKSSNSVSASVAARLPRIPGGPQSVLQQPLYKDPNSLKLVVCIEARAQSKYDRL